MVSLLWPVQASSLPVPPGSLSEQKASRTQLIFSYLQPAQTDTFSESRQTARTFKLSIFQWGQLISWKFCVEIQAVCFKLQANIQTDTPFYCAAVQCLIFSLCRKGESDSDEMDLADCLEQRLFDCWNCTLETHSQMSNESSCCGQPRWPLHIIYDIFFCGPIAVGQGGGNCSATQNTVLV